MTQTFYEKLSDGLLERGFVKSKHDACLFMKRGLLCVIYVDDTIFSGPDENQIAQEIIGLRVSKFETQHKFQLRDEGEVGDFFDIRISKQADGTFKFTQTGLIDKVLRTGGLVDCNHCTTPAATTPAGSDSEGTAFEEDWEYAYVVGMCMYLATNTRPYIAYDVHQAACHTHAPCASHAVAVNRMLRYLKGTKTQVIIVKPYKSDQVGCYVYSGFSGLFIVEDGQETISVKSRTSYVILFSGVSILWVSKIQTHIALSTMENEYIALSQSMRYLIPVREILNKIKGCVFLEDNYTPKCASHSKAFKDVLPENGDIPQFTVYEDNEA
jgi:hypothetical protein